MALVNALAAKVVVAASATTVLGIGTAAVVDRQGGHPQGRPHVTADVQAALPSPTGTGDAGTEVVIDPGTGALRLLPAGEEARAGAGAGTRTTGGSGPGRQGPVGAQTPSKTGGGSASAVLPGAGAGDTVVPGIGTGGTAGKAPVGSPPGGGGTAGNPPGGTTGGSPPPDGSGGGWTVTPPTAPDVPAVAAPTAPSSASAWSEGRFTVAVPGTGQVSKKLCLSGTAANRCQTITVPAVRPVELTVTYSGNAGVEAPKFTPAPCKGGLSIGVSGLTPGATLSVVVEGRRVSATVPEREAGQTASLCDA